MIHFIISITIPYIENLQISLDGRLQDTIYNYACKIDSLTEIYPQVGKKFSEPTEVYILQSKSGIYFGFHCKTVNRKPDKLKDYVGIFLDTFLDKLSAYYFRVYAGEQKTDARITDDGTNYDFDFETVWDTKVYCSDTYYEVEIFIPWKGLMGKKGKWGLGIIRKLPDGSVGRLKFFDPNKEIFRISALPQISPIHFGGKDLIYEISPMILLHHGEEFNDTFKYLPNIGCNLFLRVKKNFKLCFTYNPDFAEIEADPYILNVTKYTLYYPEKRPFFLEGKEYFTFSGFMPLEIFYSRQIGKTLPSKQVVPIIFGSKLFIKHKYIEIGALHTKTKSIEEEPTTDFIVSKIKFLLSNVYSFSIVNATRAPSNNPVVNLSGIENFYNTPNTQIIFQYIIDNYDYNKYATKITFSNKLKNFELFGAVYDIAYGFSDEGIGYIPWFGKRSVDCELRYIFSMNKIFYRLTPMWYISYGKEGNEPYGWQTIAKLSMNFTNHYSLFLYTGYQYKYEMKNLISSPMYGIMGFTNPKHPIYFNFCINYNKIFNYSTKTIDWLLYANLQIMYKLLNKHSILVSINRWNVINIEPEKSTITYSATGKASFNLSRLLYLNFYITAPIMGEKISDYRIGTYVDWKPFGKNKILSTYNYYQDNLNNQILINKLTSKICLSLIY